MLINEHQQGQIEIGSYQEGIIDINGKRYDETVWLMDNEIIPMVKVAPEAISAEHFQAVLDAAPRPEVVLIGTGKQQIFLHPRLTATLAQAGIGVEYMNTQAACQTYLVLQSEGRRVWAWLWA